MAFNGISDMAYRGRVAMPSAGQAVTPAPVSYRMPTGEEEQAAIMAKVAKMRENANPAEEEAAFYNQQLGAMRGLQLEASRRFREAREPMEGAVAVLGERAGTLAGSQALMQAQQSREQAQAALTVGSRTPYGGKGAGPEAAILGGQIGRVAAQSYGGLEQEAAARQAASIRGIGALGEGLMTEAEQRRLTEQEIMRDLQARFAAAQRISGAKREQAAQDKASFLGRTFGAIGTAAGAIGGAFIGGPAGAAAGASIGGSLGSSLAG